jgi:hypothetical protein
MLDESLYCRSEIALVEHDRSVWTARWYCPFSLPAGVELFPTGLAAYLAK